MQPVPVHKSSTRSLLGSLSYLSREAKCDTEAAVSGLQITDVRQTDRQTDYAKKQFTDLGMSTPGRHLISRSPKYSLPMMYCNG